MNRPSRDFVFLAIASTLATRGTCDRAYVGAVITRDGRCVSWGYNGAPPGAPHCDENCHGHAINCPSDDVPPEYEAYLFEKLETEGCRNATHAEANALAFAARQGISTAGSTLYVSVSPCEVCARLLIAAGITEIVYAREYRDRRGIELLRGAGITCRDGDSAGRPVGAS